MTAAPDDDALVAVCQAILSRTGIASDHGTISAALLDQVADQPPTRRLATPPPRQWLPVQVYAEGETLLVEWLHFGFAPLAEPFFEQSVARARTLPANRLLRCATPLAALSALDGAPPPDGLIFHMSHCGSTLVAQMIAALDRTVVVSEAPPLDLALQLYLRGWPRRRRCAA